MGSAATCTHSRAGFEGKCLAYSALTSAKSPRSVRKTVDFTTFSGEVPAASRMAATFFAAWAHLCAAVPSSSSPVSGTTGSWPLTNTSPAALTAWE